MLFKKLDWKNKTVKKKFKEKLTRNSEKLLLRSFTTLETITIEKQFYNDEKLRFSKRILRFYRNFQPSNIIQRCMKLFLLLYKINKITSVLGWS